VPGPPPPWSPWSQISRQLFLGESLDTEHIQANYDNGVLTVKIPIAERAKPRKVEISTAANAPKAIDTTSTAA
jgi:HSP20 family protein